MKKTLTTLTLATLALFGAQAAVAQDKTRAEVKKETAEANKAGAIPGTGVGQPAAAAGDVSPKEKAATTDTTRAARKESTAAANKAGKIPVPAWAKPRPRWVRSRPRKRPPRPIRPVPPARQRPPKPTRPAKSSQVKPCCLPSRSKVGALAGPGAGG